MGLGNWTLRGMRSQLMRGASPAALPQVVDAEVTRREERSLRDSCTPASSNRGRLFKQSDLCGPAASDRSCKLKKLGIPFIQRQRGVTEG